MKCWEAWSVLRWSFPHWFDWLVFSEDEWKRWQQAACGLHGQRSGLPEDRRLHDRTGSVWGLCAGRHPTFWKACQCESPHAEKPVRTRFQHIFSPLGSYRTFLVPFTLNWFYMQTKPTSCNETEPPETIPSLLTPQGHTQLLSDHMWVFSLAVSSHSKSTSIIWAFILEINPVSHSELGGFYYQLPSWLWLIVSTLSNVSSPWTLSSTESWGLSLVSATSLWAGLCGSHPGWSLSPRR